jgi:signal transduction histidine kinase
MKNVLIFLWNKLRMVLDRYPVVIAALVIYLYYLLTSFNLFQHNTKPRNFVDYVMQFDSLIFMWIAAAALLQLQKFRKEHKNEENRRREMERIFDRQQIYTSLVKDITMLLQDNVNNPLAIISLTTQEIRRRFEQDTEILHWLDRIDGAMQRIHNTIRDLQAYEAQKLMESSALSLQEQIKK